MKIYSIIIALSTSMLTGCTSVKLATVSEAERGKISWNAFCDARGYERNDNTYLAVNEYLDSWCGSVEEENAFIKAGVEP